MRSRVTQNVTTLVTVVCNHGHRDTIRERCSEIDFCAVNRASNCSFGQAGADGRSEVSNT